MARSHAEDSHVILPCFMSGMLVGSMALDLLQTRCLSFRDTFEQTHRHLREHDSEHGG